MWHKVKKRLPKTLDYYLISDGKRISVGVYAPKQKYFVDKTLNPLSILNEEVKYWAKIPILPIEKSEKVL